MPETNGRQILFRVYAQCQIQSFVSLMNSRKATRQLQYNSYFSGFEAFDTMYFIRFLQVKYLSWSRPCLLALLVNRLSAWKIHTGWKLPKDEKVEDWNENSTNNR